MDLTPEHKITIDTKSYYQLLERWRFAPVGDPWFQGETGEYWGKRMGELRSQLSDNGVQTSKDIGFSL
jgi:hypothetical protein